MVNMSRPSHSPVRRGVPTSLSLDADALPLLRTMCPNRKSFGLFLSELVRREAERRVERPKMLELLRETNRE